MTSTVLCATFARYCESYKMHSINNCYFKIRSIWRKVSTTSISKPNIVICIGFSGGSVVRNPPGNARDMSSIPGLGRSPGEGNGNSLQDSCLGNSVDRGAGRLQSTGSQRIRDDLVTKTRKQYSFKVLC